jgi:hypothetical protein
VPDLSHELTNITWGIDTKREGVRGLETAVNKPECLFDSGEPVPCRCYQFKYSVARPPPRACQALVALSLSPPLCRQGLR